MEEIEAQRIVAEQRKHMQQGVPEGDETVAMDTGLLRTPKVNVGESVEEKALRKEHVSSLICLYAVD